jgi:hypothetical protein
VKYGFGVGSGYQIVRVSHTHVLPCHPKRVQEIQVASSPPTSLHHPPPSTTTMASFFDLKARRAAQAEADKAAVPSTARKDSGRQVPWVEK